MNGVSKLDRYLISKIEDLLATLKGRRYFLKLDLQHAYQQLKLDPSPRCLWSSIQSVVCSDTPTCLLGLRLVQAFFNV